MKDNAKKKTMTKKVSAARAKPATGGYVSTATDRARSRSDWEIKRREKAEQRRAYDQLDANAKVICADDEMREMVHDLIREVTNARRRAINAGEIDQSETSIHESRIRAAKSPRALSQKKLDALRKARQMTANFRGKTGGGFGFSDSDILPSVGPTIRIPKTTAAKRAIVERIREDEALYAAVRREYTRLSTEANKGLSREQIKAKALAQTAKRRTEKKTYTITECVKKRIAKALTNAVEATRKYMEYGGERHCIRDWAKIRGISYTGLRNRLRLYKTEIALDPNFNALYKAGRICHKGKTVPAVKCGGLEKGRRGIGKKRIGKKTGIHS